MKSFLYLVLFFIVTVALTITRYGYHETINDHYVLDLKGLQQAHPEYFKNDWFVERVPQPHIVNDLFVEWSERFGVLSEAKMVHWLISAFVLAVASFLFGQWIGSLAVGLGINVLLSLGPTSPLGSGTALLGWQLPHTLGGTLLILGFMALVLDHKRLVLFCLFLIPLAHVQHGLHFGLLTLAWSVFMLLLRKPRWQLLAASLSCILFSLLIANAVQVSGGTSTFSDACKSYTPFHCYSSSWPKTWWLTGVFVLFAQLPLIHYLKKNFSTQSRAMAYTLISINVCYFLCIGLEYFEVEPLASVVRGTNFFRWITLLIYCACCGLMLLLKNETSKLKKVICFYILFGGVFLTSYSAAGEHLARRPLVLLLIIIGIFLFVTTKFTPTSWRVTLINLCLMLLLWGIAMPAPNPSPLFNFGREIESQVPAGETLIASPGITILRRISHRAVIADSKGIPYGMPYIAEWKERIQDLGGGSNEGYTAIPYDTWLATAKKYNAKYAVALANDSRLKRLLKEHQVLAINENLGIALFKLNF